LQDKEICKESQYFIDFTSLKIKSSLIV